MRLGIMPAGSGDRLGPDALVERAVDIERRGFATLWIPNVFGLDAVVASAIVGRATSRIEIGTAVVPTQPRHPAALAQQAATAGVACGGRFTLGIGLSHPPIIEGMLGLSYRRRAAHMREYMNVLGPLLRGEPARYEGEEFRVNVKLGVPEAPEVPVVIAALGERMLEIAGREASGTILWMVGPRTIEQHIAPTLRRAARESGRPEPRIVAGMHIALTNEPEVERARVARRLAVYAQMPSYRAMLEREGSPEPDDIALLGDERRLDEGLARLEGLGVSDFEASILPTAEGGEERTLEYLASRL